MGSEISVFIIPKIGLDTSIIVPCGHSKSILPYLIGVLLHTTEEAPKLPRVQTFKKAFGLDAKASIELLEYILIIGINANVIINIIQQRLLIISKYALTPYPRIKNGFS
jgi:hypothetical protein